MNIIKELGKTFKDADQEGNLETTQMTAIALALAGILDQLERLNKSVDRLLYFKIGPT